MEPFFLLLLLWWLEQLDLADDLAVEDEEHVADHTEHENLDTYDNEEYGEDRERDMLDMAGFEPFQQDIEANEYPEEGSENSHHPEIKHRVVPPRQPVDRAYDLNTVMERGELGCGSRSAGVPDRDDHDPLAVPDRLNGDLRLDLEPFLFQVHLVDRKLGECTVP